MTLKDELMAPPLLVANLAMLGEARIWASLLEGGHGSHPATVQAAQISAQSCVIDSSCTLFARVFPGLPTTS